MARRGVTRDAVETAMHELTTADLPTSIRKIREHLGDTGSLKTIAGHVRAIQADRWERAGPALPDPLVQQLLKGAAEYWADLSGAADDQIEDIKTQTSTAIKTMEKDVFAARQAERQALDQLAAHKQTVRSLERHLAEKTDSLTKLSDEKTSWTSKELTLQTEKDSAAANYRQLDKEHTTLQMTLNELTSKLQNTEKSHRLALDIEQKRLTDTQIQVKHQSTTINEQALRLGEQTEQLTSVHQLLQKSRDIIEGLTQKYQALELEHRELTTALQLHINQFESVQAENETLKEWRQQQSTNTESLLSNQHEMITNLGVQLAALSEQRNQ